LTLGDGLAVKLAATAVPVVIGFANGFDASGNPSDYFGRIAADTVISGLTVSATNFLYAVYLAGTVTLSPSTLAPIYSASVAPNILGSDLTSAASATTAASASSNAAGYDAFNAFQDDGTDGTSGGQVWIATNNVIPSSLTWDFGSTTTVHGYSLMPDSTRLGHAPNTWTIEGWDGSVWVVVDTRSGESGWVANVKRTYAFTAPASYSKFRINVTAVNGATQIAIGEMEYLGAPATGQRWFDLSAMTPKKWNGSAWVGENWCALGEAVTNASAVTSVITYALRGKYNSGRFAIGVNTNYLKNHNLGVTPVNLRAMGATAAGGVLYDFQNIYNAAYKGAWFLSVDKTAYTLSVQSSTANLLTGLAAGTTAVEAVVTCERGW
jgi:hypothetical protein